MFVSLNGERVALTLGRWDARKAISDLVDCEKEQELIDLVATSGTTEAARLLGLTEAEVSRRNEISIVKVAKARRLTSKDLTIVDLIDDLGYTGEAAAEALEMPLREVRCRYWRARAKLRGQRHDETLCRHIPALNRRDYIAYELVHVLHYSIGRASRMLGLNRGHLCRRLQKVKQLLQTHVQPDTPSINT
jgi:DNA-directed RNA polymerase specialized sigma24 family protein